MYDDLSMYEHDGEVSHESMAGNTLSESIVPAIVWGREKKRFSRGGVGHWL